MNQIASASSPVVANQPHVMDLSNKTPKGRRRVRALLGLGKDETVSPGLVCDARARACGRTLKEAHRTHASK